MSIAEWCGTSLPWSAELAGLNERLGGVGLFQQCPRFHLTSALAARLCLDRLSSVGQPTAAMPSPGVLQRSLLSS